MVSQSPGGPPNHGAQVCVCPNNLVLLVILDAPHGMYACMGNVDVHVGYYSFTIKITSLFSLSVLNKLS